MSTSGQVFRARVRFLTHDEGGRLNLAMSGFRPQLRVGEISTSAIVRSVAGDAYFDTGVEVEVDIELMHWDVYGHLLSHEDQVVLLEGSRTVAMGVFVAQTFDDPADGAE